MQDTEAISLRVSLTERCQLRCQYCRPAGACPPPGSPLPAATWLQRIEAISGAVTVSKLRFTGGEPLLYPQLEDLVAGCASLGIPDLAMTTNGIGLARRTEALRRGGLCRINVSLDCLDPRIYRRMTGGTLYPVLAGIAAAKRAGFEIKLNVVAMRGINDGTLFDLLAFASRQQASLRFLELMPIGAGAGRFDKHFIPGEEMMARIGQRLDLEALPYHPGETSRDFRVRWPDGRESICGFIMPTSTPFCDGCRRLRLCADGELVGCLAQPDRVKLNGAFDSALDGNYGPLRQGIRDALAIKSRPQRFREQHAMVNIGG